MEVTIMATAAATMIYTEPLFNKTQYHTSSLSGLGWVHELLDGHPEYIQCELGVQKHVFKGLVSELQKLGLGDLKHITLIEQLAISLFMYVTGLSVQHVGERF